MACQVNGAGQQAEQDGKIQERMAKIKNKVLVMSGKGGVGKTTVAVNLARGLAAKGYKVGLMDTDIHGPNVSKMLGADEHRFVATDDGIEPPQVEPNLVAASLVFSGQADDQPIIWRGPLKQGLIKQFLSDIIWGELDYLIIDSPPGTGDEPLSVCQLLPDLSGAVVVTTPQEVAVLDSRKSVGFARQIGAPLLGIVENMSGFVCPDCGTTHYLFGQGGGEKAAREMNTDFLGAIPMEQAMMEFADRGQSFVASGVDTPSAKAMREVVDKIEAKLQN